MDTLLNLLFGYHYGYILIFTKITWHQNITLPIFQKLPISLHYLVTFTLDVFSTLGISASVK